MAVLDFIEVSLYIPDKKDAAKRSQKASRGGEESPESVTQSLGRVIVHVRPALVVTRAGY